VIWFHFFRSSKEKQMTDCFVYDTVRTPRGKGKKDGSLHEVTALELGTQVLKNIRDRNNLDTSLVDDVVYGCVDPVGEQGADIARLAVLNADYAESTAGVQINRFCASGLEACNMAAGQVMSGQSDMTIGGGVESMSRVGMGASGGSWSVDPNIAFKSYFSPQGIGADLIATMDGFSRDDVDAYAVESQKRAANAWKNGYFKNSVTPVKDILGQTILDHDEHMRPDATMQSMASLNPAFAQLGDFAGFDAVAQQRYPQVEKINHVHHAGNSSGIVDGAAAVLMGTKEAGKSAGLKPRARIRAFGSIGSEPMIMLTGPSYVTEKVLKRAGMTAKDIDLFELNEAFASVVLRFMQKLDIPHDKINVNGGAIAMGHPLGATGAMILGTVLDELERRNLNTALITLCVGAGMGTATIIERV
jgi:acetyl-CoA C-acetyltransferase